MPRIAAIAAVSFLALAACGSASTSGTSPSGRGASTPTASQVQPRGPVDSGVPVTRVVDGDTIHVLLAGRDTTVRLVGINTPETVKPDSPVECFGPEASDYAKQALTGQTVTLEYDDSQGRRDRYGRTLAYVWIELPVGGLDLFNLDAVAGGYAQERQYGPNRFAWQDLFRAAEQGAQAAGAGMWTACPAHS